MFGLILRCFRTDSEGQIYVKERAADQDGEGVSSCGTEGPGLHCSGSGGAESLVG